MQKIIEWDIALMQWLNTGDFPFLDDAMWLFSEKLFWLPVYAILLVIIYQKLGLKLFLVTLIFIALTVVLNDQIASGVFKNWIGRLRPSYDDRVKDLLHYVKEPNGQWYKGGKFGFYSSHAANYAGVTTFFILAIRPKRWMILALIGWTLLISYSRIYLGVHFPTDILMGLAMGTLIGLVCYFGWKFTLRRYFSTNKSL